jgi:hypothetical protein
MILKKQSAQNAMLALSNALKDPQADIRIIQSLVTAWFLFSCAHAEDEALSKVFSASCVQGTIVLLNFDGSRKFVHNDKRAHNIVAF